MMSRRTRTRTAALVLSGAVIVALAGCQAGSRVAASSSQAASVAGSPPAPQGAGATFSAPPPVGKGTGGPGSLTVSLTSPEAVSGHVNTPVSCETGARRYVSSANGTVNGRNISETVWVANYQGPGSYPAVVTVSVSSSTTGTYAISAVPTTAEITSTGGSVSFSAQSSGGRTLAGSITWACSG